MGELFPLKEVVKEMGHGGKKFEFKLRELSGVSSDEITDGARTGTGTSAEMSISKFNRERILRSVVESKCNTVPFDIAKEIDGMPRKLYSQLVKEIDNLNTLSEEEGKN